MRQLRAFRLSCVLALCLAVNVASKASMRSMPSGHVKMARATSSGISAHLKQFLLRVHSANGKSENIKNELEQLSHGPVHYVPHDTYIVTLEPSQVDHVRSLSGVDDVYEVPKEMKSRAAHHSKHEKQGKKTASVESSIIRATLAVSRETAEKRKLDVREWAAVIKEKTGADVNIAWASSNSIEVKVPEAVAHKVTAALQTMDLVHQASVTPKITILSKAASAAAAAGDASKSGLRNKWSGNLVQSGNASASPLWDAGLNGEGQVIGCGDSGIDMDSCFFFDATPLGMCKGEGYIPNCDSTTHRKIVTYRTVSGAEFADDDWPGHGTHVVGTIAGLSSDAAMSEYNGVAPMAKIAFDDIGQESSGWLWLPASWEESLYPHSYAHGAKIHSNSWGDSAPYYTGDSYSNDKFSHDNDDFLLLFAAGNSGPWPSTIGSQAAAKNVIAVGAGENHPESYADGGAGRSIHNVVDFSSKGPTLDGLFKPTVVAPGDNIMSADSDALPYSFQCSAGMEGATELLSGTSMATPACAGGAALIRQYFENGYFATGAADPASGMIPSAALVTAVLIHSGKPMAYYDWNFDATGNFGLLPAPATLPHSSQGFGRVDLDSVLYLGPQSPFSLFFHDRVTLQPDQTLCYGYTAAGGGQFKASVAWTDPAASPYSAFSRTLIQDMDLVVVSPSGAIIRGNHLDGGVRERRNNQEQVTVAAAEAGVYSVYVVAYDLPAGPQNFSLVVTADATAATSCSAPELSCPNGCGIGVCKVGMCECSGTGGFSGPDCSIPPLIEPVCKQEVVAELSGRASGQFSVPGTVGIHFKSDAHVGDDGMRTLWPGMELTYTVGEPSVYSVCNSPGRAPILHRQSDGVITTGDGYEDYTTCHWWIRPSRNPSRVVSLSFLMMDLEPDYDFVHVRECHNWRCSQTSLLGSYTGSTIPPLIVASAVRPILVTFQSDYSITYPGFAMAFSKGQMSVSSSECVPGQLVALPSDVRMGSIKLPMINGTYAPNLDCAFVLDGGSARVSLSVSVATEFGVDVLEISSLTPNCATAVP